MSPWKDLVNWLLKKFNFEMGKVSSKTFKECMSSRFPNLGFFFFLNGNKTLYWRCGWGMKVDKGSTPMYSWWKKWPGLCTNTVMCKWAFAGISSNRMWRNPNFQVLLYSSDLGVPVLESLWRCLWSSSLQLWTLPVLRGWGITCPWSGVNGLPSCGFWEQYLFCISSLFRVCKCEVCSSGFLSFII